MKKYIIYRINSKINKYLSENKSWYGDLDEAYLFNEVEDAQKEIQKICGDNVGHGVYSGKLGILEYEKTLIDEVIRT